MEICCIRESKDTLLSISKIWRRRKLYLLFLDRELWLQEVEVVVVGLWLPHKLDQVDPDQEEWKW